MSRDRASGIPANARLINLVPKEQTLGPGVATIGQTDDVVGHDVTLLTRKSRFEKAKGEQGFRGLNEILYLFAEWGVVPCREGLHGDCLSGVIDG